MSDAHDSETESLLDAAVRGDGSALPRLLEKHRDGLRQMVAVRFDRRLAPRVDASDVVQEVLKVANRRFPQYLRTRPLPFACWLDQIAAAKLKEQRRWHVVAQRRSVERESPGVLLQSDTSAAVPADRLIDSGTSPSGQVQRAEQNDQVRAAVERLPPRDRQLVILRCLEGRPAAEVGQVMGISPENVRTRYVRALKRLKGLLHDAAREEDGI
jgi:RNA polymerase sigma-70 factor (ECF subfamily)